MSAEPNPKDNVPIASTVPFSKTGDLFTEK